MQQAAVHPKALVQSFLKVCRQLKKGMRDANRSKDPVHFVVLESLRQTEGDIFLICDRKQLSVS